MSGVILPEVLVEYIISFIYDRRGYNIFNYNERKKENLDRMTRLKREIKYFGNTKLSIFWLKGSRAQRENLHKFKKSLKDGYPIVAYHIGCYVNSYDEFHSDIYD
tara:strand:+ start:294 stop:608 length:315 start_codon:yes stop_codon:yes gene_type:complete